MKTRIVVACGGTGGHVHPGIAVADELRGRGWRVELLLAGKELEQRTVSGWEGEICTVNTVPPVELLSPRIFKAVLRMVSAGAKSWRVLGDRDVAGVLAMGGYGCVWPLAACTLRGVPFVLHEGNAVPGRTISLFSRWARAVAVAFPEAERALERAKRVVDTGLPVRRDILAAAQHRTGSLPPDGRRRVLVLGGSGGARALNVLVPRVFGRLAARGVQVDLIHIAGPGRAEEAREAYGREGVRAEVVDYSDRIEELYVGCDLAICRAGASTCAEVAVMGIPAVFIPYPYAVRDHQAANAAHFAGRGAALVVEEGDLQSERFVQELGDLLLDGGRLQGMGTAMRSLARPDAAVRVADLVEEAIRGGPGGTSGGAE